MVLLVIVDVLFLFLIVLDIGFVLVGLFVGFCVVLIVGFCLFFFCLVVFLIGDFVFGVLGLVLVLVLCCIGVFLVIGVVCVLFCLVVFIVLLFFFI